MSDPLMSMVMLEEEHRLKQKEALASRVAQFHGEHDQESHGNRGGGGGAGGYSHVTDTVSIGAGSASDPRNYVAKITSGSPESVDSLERTMVEGAVEEGYYKDTYRGDDDDAPKEQSAVRFRIPREDGVYEVQSYYVDPSPKNNDSRVTTFYVVKDNAARSIDDLREIREWDDIVGKG